MDQNKFHSEFVKNINNICGGNEYTDVYLTYPDGNESIPSVRVLLASQSRYFYNKFYVDWRDRNDMIVTLEELDYNTFKIFKILHNCIFGFAIDFSVLSADDQVQLLRLSEYYWFKSVEGILYNHLRNVTHDNCWAVFKFANERNDESFADSCAQFISQNIQNIAGNPNFLDLNIEFLKSLLSRNTFYLPEEEIFSAVLKWHEQHLNDDVSHVLSHSIRLFLVSSEDIQRVLREFWHIEERYERNYRYLVPITPLIPKDHYDFQDSNVSVKKALEMEMPLEIIATLKCMHLINHFSLKFKNNEQMQYKINVSKDGCIWEPIVDYFNYQCHGYQEIYFEPIHVKYMQFIAINVRKSPLPIHFSDDSASSSLLWSKIDSFEMKFTENPLTMSNNGQFLIPNYNIAAHCIGPGIGFGERENFTVKENKTMEEKYRNIFRGDMDADGGNYMLQLPQPCVISNIQFLIYDRETIRPAHYRIETFPSYNGSFPNSQWTTVYETSESDRPEGCYGPQEVIINPTPVSFIRIVPTKLFNYKKRRIFSIVDFKCYGTTN